MKIIGGVRAYVTACVVIVVAIFGFITGALYSSGPNATALTPLTWDGVGAAMTFAGTIATFSAAGVALWIASQDRSRRKTESQMAAKALCISILPEFAAVRRILVGIRRDVRSYRENIRNIRMIEFAAALAEVDLPLTRSSVSSFLLLESRLAIDVANVLSKVELARNKIRRWSQMPHNNVAEEAANMVAEAQRFANRLQLIVEPAYDGLRELAGLEEAKPQIDGIELDIDERRLALEQEGGL